MKPVLSAWPPLKRSLAFAPFALGFGLLAFLVLGFATQSFFLSLLLGPPLGVAGAWALVGWPEVRTKDGRPVVAPAAKPYLWFLLAPLLALVTYWVVGITLTEAGLPPDALVYVALPVALLAGGAGAYFLVGFPRVLRSGVEAYRRLPAERRPFLFFPLFVLFFLVLYLALGVATTAGLGRMGGNTSTLLNLQVLAVLPLSVLLAALFAYLLVGIPKPQRAPTEYLPKVTGKHRPRAFLLTFLLAGIPLTVVVGSLLTYLAKTSPGSSAFLPAELVLPLAVALGYALAAGLAVLAWGTPRSWRRFEDYTPGLSPRARGPVFAGASLASGLAVIVVFGVVGLDLFWGILAGALLAGVVALWLTGAGRALVQRRRRGDPLVPELPDAAKPLVLFPTWFGLAFLVFAILTYLLPALVAWNALAGIVVGLVVAFLLLESPLLRDLREERRREREKRKAWEARRKQALQEGEESPPA